jgi:hypothetical protein
MDATVRKLTAEEINLMQFHRDMAAKICKKYVPDFNNTYDSRLLSKAFALWLEDKSEFVKQNYDLDFHAESARKPTGSMIKLALGTVYGDMLNKLFQSEWVHITDQYGAEICVRHEGSKYITFPYSSIEKRFASKELNFFEAIEEMMKMQVQKSKA